MTKGSKSFKRLFAAFVAVSAIAIAGTPNQAHALGFPNGDLALVVYGGDTEYYRNLGSLSSLLAPGVSNTFQIDPGHLSQIQIGATTGLQYTLLGISSDSTSFKLGTSLPGLPSEAQRNNSFPALAADNFGLWQGQHGAATGGATANNPSLTSKAAAHSFTAVMGTSGRLNGSMGYNIQQAIGSGLTMHNIDIALEEYTLMGNALLTAGGTLFLGNPAVVPVPAAVVLFGTGLVGLVGVARRSFMKKQAA